MTRGIVFALSICAVLCFLTGCDRAAQDGPPVVHLDSSVCDECGMILSDERFVAATIVESTRGQEARLFDDYNCQINFEHAHPEQVITTRWAHDYSTSGWIQTERAFFLLSPQLRTPMASETAAFGNRSDADAALEEFGGEIMNAEALWEAFAVDR